MNEEGTFIAGSFVASGYALSKANYMQHKSCGVCRDGTTRCLERERLLSPRKPRRLESSEDEGYIEFFLSSEGISPQVLDKYLEVNAGKHSLSIRNKRFKVHPTGSIHFDHFLTCLAGSRGILRQVQVSI
jgi:hypothetical protein